MSTPDWKSLKGARGPATAIPNDLDALRSSDPGIRVASASNLAAALYADDRWFSASAPALSALLVLASDPTVPVRARCLIVATDILVTGHMRRLAKGLDQRDPAIKKRYARGAAKEVYASALAGVPGVRALLEDGEASVRAAAALFLAYVSAAAKESDAALRERLAVENDDHVRASVIVALGLISRYADEVRGVEDLALEERGGSPIVAGALVLARLHRHPSAPEGEPFRELVDLVRRADVGLERFPWAYGRVDRLTSLMVEGLVPNGPLVSARLLAEAVAAAAPGEPLIEAWGRAALQLGFGLADHLREASSLTGEQRDVAAALSCHQLELPFSAYEIPFSVRDRRRWLGMDPPGPLEAIVKVEGDPESAQEPIWRVIVRMQRDNVPEEVVYQRLRDSLPPERLAAVYGEIDRGAYGTRRPSADRLSEALEASGDKAVDWARWMAEQLLAGIALGEIRTGPSLGNMAVRLIAGKTPEGPVLDERYDPLISPAGKDLVAALPPDRRERVLTRFLEQPLSYPSVERFKLSLVEPVLHLCPTQSVAAGVLTLCKAILRNRYPVYEDEQLARKALKTLESLRGEPGVAEALREQGG